jgi:tetratricopeptide (TPR) repeat protein
VVEDCLDEEGRLIGLTSYSFNIKGQKLYFALPVEWIIELPERHKKMSKVTQTYLTEWLKKSIILEEKKDWAGLLTHSLRWTEAQPQEDAAWFSLGIAYGESEQFIEAIKSFKQALNINRNSADTWFNQGLIYSKVGEYVEAIESFKQAVNINREFTSAWVNLGIAYYQIGQTSQVKEVYQILKKLDPVAAEEFNKLFVDH